MSQPSPAWLRFGYAADEIHIRLQVLKCRGRELTRPLITLDRAAVQARLYGQMRAARLLDSTVEFGTTALGQIATASQYATAALDSLAAKSAAPSHLDTQSAEAPTQRQRITSRATH